MSAAEFGLHLQLEVQRNTPASAPVDEEMQQLFGG